MIVLTFLGEALRLHARSEYFTDSILKLDELLGGSESFNQCLTYRRLITQEGRTIMAGIKQRLLSANDSIWLPMLWLGIVIYGTSNRQRTM